MYRPRFPYVRSALHTVDRPMSRSNSLHPSHALAKNLAKILIPPRLASPAFRFTRRVRITRDLLPTPSYPIVSIISSPLFSARLRFTLRLVARRGGRAELLDRLNRLNIGVLNRVQIRENIEGNDDIGGKRRGGRLP